MALPLINTSVPYDTEKPVVTISTSKKSLPPVETDAVDKTDLNPGEDDLIRRLPTIVSLQDTGKPELYKSDILDTNLQKAIRRAKERIARGEGPYEPEEWRLPGAPLPARPDYTRTCPNLGRPPFLKTRGKLASGVTEDRMVTTHSAPANVSSSDGIGYLPPLTAGYLQAMSSYPTLYPLSGGDMKNLTKIPQPKVYMPFVDNAMLHPKFVTAVEIRDKQYVVPEFCYGCRAFVDPSHEHTTPTIDNWTSSDGDIHLPPGLCYACALSHVPHFHHERPVRVGGGFTFFKRDRPIDFGITSIPGSRRSDLPAPTLVCYDVPEMPEERDIVTVAKIREPATPRRLPTTPREVPPRVPQFIRDKMNDENAKPKIYEDVHRYFQMIQEKEEVDVVVQPTPTPQPPTPPPEKPRLWKAPKAFQLKRSEKKATEAKDPFSDDRDLNVPKYKGFELKKSDKAVTVPVDFEKSKPDYTPPKKWEPKKPEPKAPTVPIERPERTEKLYTAPPPPKPRPKKVAQPPPPPPPAPKPKAKPPPPQRDKPIIIPKPKTPTPEPPRADTPDSGVESVPPEPPKPRTPTPTPPPPPKEPTPPPPTPTPPPPPKEPTPEPEPEPTPPPPPKEPTPEPTPPPPKSPTPPPPEPPPPVQKKKKEPPPPKKKVEKPKRVKPVPKPKVQEIKQVKPPTPPPVVEKPPSPEPEPPKPPTPVPIEVPPLPPAPELPPTPPPKTPTPEPEPEEPEPEPPKMPTPEPEPEKLPPPPKVKAAIKWKRRPPKRKWKRMGEPTPAPRTDESADSFKDPLDYLAKYCIVHKERLPAYQRVFNGVMKKKGVRPDQLLPTDHPTLSPKGKTLSVQGRHRRSSGLPSDSGSEDSGYNSSRSVTSNKEDDTIMSTFAQSKTVTEEAEDGYVSPLKITFTKPPDEDERAESPTSDLGTLSRSSSFVGSSFDADEQVDRVKYILDTNREKISKLKNNIKKLEDERIRLIAKAAREEFPQILRQDYEPPVKKEKGGKKGKKKDKGSKGHTHSPKGTVRFMTDDQSVRTLMSVDNGETVEEKPKYNPFSDAFVISRLDKDKLAMLETMTEVEKIDLEMGRSLEKLDYAEKRIVDLQVEGNITVRLLERFEKDEDERRPAKSPDFRRKQSPKYQKMNPITDLHMSVEEVEPALRQINGYLITEKECEYVYHVLDLPQRSKINFKLFTVVAALSEKVSRLDPFVRKLINKLDFEALDVKLQYAKELFRLLCNDEDDQDFGPGEVSIRNLAIECAAGGIAKHNTQFVVDKFNREGKNYVDFLDYLTYIPLFIEIHENICKNPLTLDRTR